MTTAAPASAAAIPITTAAVPSISRLTLETVRRTITMQQNIRNTAGFQSMPQNMDSLSASPRKRTAIPEKKDGATPSAMWERLMPSICRSITFAWRNIWKYSNKYEKLTFIIEAPDTTFLPYPELLLYFLP